MSELKCCPFCGGEAILDREDIFCDYCHLSMRIDDRLYNREVETYEEAKQQAIENWNTRTPMANIVKELEELKMRYFLTIANTGDVKNDFAYENVGNALDNAINIVQQEINNGLE